MFDLVLFLSFSIVSFSAYILTNEAGVTGAVASIIALTLISVTLIFSR